VTLSAEAIKLSTTRGPRWLTLLAAVLSLALAALQGIAAAATTEVPPGRAAIGVATVGIPLMMVLAALSVIGEFRTGTIRTTFMAMPGRARVLVAKTLITAVLSGVFAAVTTIVSIVLVRQLTGERVGVQLTFSNSEVWYVVGAVTVYAILGAVLAVGLAALLRHAAAVVVVLLLVPFAIEPLLGSAPRIGQHIGPLLPFVNALAFTHVPWFMAVPPRWGPLGSLLYFTGIVAVVFAAALVVISRRDP
jgi:ABC-2 type transport system permease protein